MLNRSGLVPLLAALALSPPLVTAAETGTAPGLIRALTGGDFHALFNYRYEYVEDPAARHDARASTLRSVLGYDTGRYYGFKAGLELEDVRVIGNDLYNDGGSNGRGSYAVVVDPEGTEINQAWIGFGKLANVPVLKETEVKAGRQAIAYRDAPWHRFIGPVVWRQNWQTFDGYTLSNNSLADTRVNLAYIYNINRIYGEDNPAPGLHDKKLDGYLFNVRYAGFSPGALEAYAYLLDFRDTNTPAAAFFQSTRTYGVRFNGKHKLGERLTLLYAAEAAFQSDYAGNPNAIGSHYYQLELGATWNLHRLVDTLTLKASYELLSGDGGADRFTTPLATLHAYQGWADKFLNTPGDGIEDIYATLALKALGAGFTAVYHDLGSDNGGYGYGSELDLLLSRPFGKHVTAGLKYADYNADGNDRNVARNPGQRTDITKFWAFLTLKF